MSVSHGYSTIGAIECGIKINKGSQKGEKSRINVAKMERPIDVYYTTYYCGLVLGLQAQSFVGK